MPGAAFCIGKLNMSIPLRTNYPTREIGRQVDHETLKRHDYDEQGIVVARIDDQRLSEWERQFLKNVGE
jgi:hypothetical protein